MKHCIECSVEHDELGYYCESCITELIENREDSNKRGG
jgi:hypothetical protein